MTRTAQAKALILTVFLIGLMTGGLLMDFYQGRVEGNDTDAQQKQSEVGRFEDYLRLDGQQREELREILERTESAFDALRQQTRPMYRVLRERSRDEIRGILTVEQQLLYDEWRSRQDRRGTVAPANR